MSLSRTARRISLPALLAIGPGRATPAGASAGAAVAGDGHLAKPVIVLEHGAWADASSWSSVISRLQRSGFIVYSPPNPLRGLPQDSAYLHQFPDPERGPGRAVGRPGRALLRGGHHQRRGR